MRQNLSKPIPSGEGEFSKSVCVCLYQTDSQVKLQKSVIGPAYASGCIWGVGFACMMSGTALTRVTFYECCVIAPT